MTESFQLAMGCRAIPAKAKSHYSWSIYLNFSFRVIKTPIEWIVCFRSRVKLASLFVIKQTDFALLLFEYTPKLESLLYELLSLDVLKKPIVLQLLHMANFLFLSSIMWTWIAFNSNLMEPDGVELANIQHDWCSNDSIFKIFCHNNKCEVMITHSWPKK